MSETHAPVLVVELIEALKPRVGDIFVDCTFGAGGHAHMVAEAIAPAGRLIAIDRDERAEQEFGRFSAEAKCDTTFVRSDFCTGLQQLVDQGVRAKGVYMDLGVSSMQIDTRERGFSYSSDAPLDMRMDTGQELSAYEVVNEWPEQRLVLILRQYGEERFARTIASEIVRARGRQPITSTAQLVEVVKRGVPRPAQFAAGHPAKRVFQAIRIAVNAELELLDSALPLAWELLAPDAVMAVISFHSLEDRRVKSFFAAKARGCICPPDLPVCACGRKPVGELIRRRVVVPSATEIEQNPRARSAKLRAVRKIASEGQS